MKYLISLLLGLVQGLCEFLPVSSSGHLFVATVLTGNAVDTEMFGSFYSVMLHLATLVAVVIVYRKRLWQLIRHPFQKTVLHLIIATLPTVLFALFLKAFDSLDAWLENGNLLGFSFLLTACFLFLADRLTKKGKARRSMEQMRWTDALAIGGMQAVGVLPGVSRSGSTIAGAVFAGLDRKSAADFSFLLSIPAILGATCLETLDLLTDPVAFASIANTEFLLCLLIGTVTAGVVGYFAVRYMIRLITKGSLMGFVLYTAVLGCFVLVCQCFGWLGFGFTPFGG